MAQRKKDKKPTMSERDLRFRIRIPYINKETKTFRSLIRLEIFQSLYLPLQKTLNARRQAMGLGIHNLAINTELSTGIVGLVLTGKIKSESNQGLTNYFENLYAIAKVMRLEVKLGVFDVDTGEQINDIRLNTPLYLPSKKTKHESEIARHNFLSKLCALVRNRIVPRPEELEKFILVCREVLDENERLREWIDAIDFETTTV